MTPTDAVRLVLGLPSSLLALALPSCTRPHPSQAPAVAPDPPSKVHSAAASPDTSTPDDLGPGDAIDPATPTEKGDGYMFADGGPDRLFGTRGDGRRRPNAPGTGGTLRVAIDTPYQLFGRASSYLHVVAWRNDGKPAAGARVFIGRRSVGRTDADGTLVFRYRQPEPTQGDDLGAGMEPLFVIDGSRCGTADFTPYRRTPTFASDQLYVYTDRGVYRPGETARVRVIGWRLEADYAPIVGGDVELVLRDRAGHSLVAATIHTDEFGAGTADLKVPLTADAGDYELAIAYGGARESTDLQIRRFEAPQLRIEHTLPRHITRDRDALAFDVLARPTTGEKLGKARIDVVVASPDGRTVKVGRDVDGNGPHAFELDRKQLDAVRDASSDGWFRAAITVRDALGRQDTMLRVVTVSDNPYVAVLEPDKDAYTTGDEVVVVARISDLDDVAVRNRVVSLVLGDKTRITVKTDANGLATFRFAMPGTGQDLALHVADVERPIATSHIDWAEPLAMKTELGEAVVRERAVVKVAARFPRGHVPVDRRVHVDITDTSGAIVGATILRATQEKGGWVARGEITAPTWGSSLLTFFALGKGELDPREGDEPTEKGKLGLLVAGQEIAVVPDRELQIELRGVPDRAAPGEAIDAAAVVRDRSGKPVEFAASAAVVDSAVLALNDPLEVTPMDRFYDPELRTLGTTGAQMLTWPVVTRNWGAHRWDVALPPFPFLGPGGADSCRLSWDAQDVAAFEKTAQGASAFGFGSGSGSGSGYGSGAIGLGSIGTIGHGRGGGGLPTITVRKRFGDTSLWEGNLRGRGEAAIQATLPDGIGEQELVVVASDRNGGVGVARKRITVDQSFFVEADLPSVVVAGERIEIPVVAHNRGDAALAVDVALQGRHAKLSVGKGDQRGTMLELGALAPGVRSVVVEGNSGAHIDRVLRDVLVVPAGVPTTRARTGVAREGKPWSAALDGAEGASAYLRIDVPAVTAAFVGIDALLETVADDPWALASDLSAASILLRLADREKLASAKLTELRGQVLAAVAMTSRVQRTGGGFGYWRNGKSSPYVTALVLDGLLDARDAGIRVPPKTIAAAADFLAAQLPDGALKDLRDIGWWEGDDAATRRAIESEIFAVVARLEAGERSVVVDAMISAMIPRAEKTIAETTDVRALASATLGLLHLRKIDGTRVAAIAKRLIDARDHGHWEPTWFSAWGGTIEATSAALQVLAVASEHDFASEKRDGVRWLLSTREAWGTWHNERGTVAALRAIAAVATPRIDRPTEIVVRGDGEVIARARIDGADPLAGAAALAHLDLALAAVPGKHTVQVEADGPIAPGITLVEQRWQAAKGARTTRDGLVLEATGAASVASGTASTLAITAKGRRLGGATIRIAHGGLVDVDLTALGDRVGRGGAIAKIRPLGDALELHLAPTATELDLELPVVARRRGTGHWPTVALVPIERGGASSRPLVVDPGALTID